MTAERAPSVEELRDDLMEAAAYFADLGNGETVYANARYAEEHAATAKRFAWLRDALPGLLEDRAPSSDELRNTLGALRCMLAEPGCEAVMLTASDGRLILDALSRNADDSARMDWLETSVPSGEFRDTLAVLPAIWPGSVRALVDAARGLSQQGASNCLAKEEAK